MRLPWQRDLPKFCKDCGCPYHVEWIKDEPVFNEKTGEGKVKLRKYWVCSNKQAGFFHTVLNQNNLRETKYETLPIKEEC